MESKRIGGAERNIYNLVHLISLKSREDNLVVSDKGIWEYDSKSYSFKKIKNINLFFLLIKNHNNHNISNIHVHSNGYYIFLYLYNFGNN